MNDRTLKNMERRLKALEREAVRLRKGVVTSMSPVTIELGDSGVGHEDVPVAGTLGEDETVAVLTRDNGMLALGGIHELPHAHYRTTLPSSPFNGQEIYFYTSSGIWHLRYRSNAPSSYKWEYVGGTPLLAEVTTDETRAATTYGDLSTAGPSITVPLAGTYRIKAAANIYTSTGSQFNALAAVKLGSAATSDNERVLQVAGPASGLGVADGVLADGRIIERTVSASDVLKLQYRALTTVTMHYAYRCLEVTPVRVG